MPETGKEPGRRKRSGLFAFLGTRPNSLTARVLLYTSIWSAIAVVIMALVMSALYRRTAERGLHELLRAQLFSAINSVSIDPNTHKLVGSPQLSELGFLQPGSGWYWVVQPLGDYKTDPLTSSNYEGVPTLPNAVVPLNPRFERYYATRDKAGNDVRVAEAEISLQEDEPDDVEATTVLPDDAVYRVVRFRMIGNQNVVEEDVRVFNRSLYLALAIFAIGLLGLNAMAILIGLKPLDRVRESLTKVRNGEAERIDEGLPREIAPLASEVNALIESNRRVMERARMQVGNLAHSLKTPIAVLLNDAGQMPAQHGGLVRSQAEIMQAQVQSYLNRARIAAQRDSIMARTELQPVLERLLRVMRKLNADKSFELSVLPPGLMLAMEAQDIEETLGNLIENASRFAENRVVTTARIAPSGTVGADPARRAWALITVEDDGAGLEPDEIREAMKRGRRLDESRPGTGLGLSIVTEIVSEYQGLFSLGRAGIGGLRAELILPVIVKDAEL